MHEKQKWAAYMPILFNDYLEEVREYHQNPEYQKAMRKRSYWLEPLFGRGKRFLPFEVFAPAGNEAGQY